MRAALIFAAAALILGVHGDKTITVTNKCQDKISIGVLTNGQGGDSEQRFELSSGSSQSVSKPEKWGGRVWGRHDCSGDSKCTTPGAGNPASLAEFFFKGVGDHDYYDISLVDGYNLPVTITPEDGGGGGGSGSGKYKCGSPSCDVPKCPNEYAIVDSSGKVTSCQSSCSKTNSDEHCCKGDHDDPSVCKPDQQSKAIKEACPDAYSFAYDDQTSTFNCQVSKYTVKFC